MTSTRQDAWTADEDLLLAEVILRHIREGGTQLQAFEEVGKKLSRTSAACGFRWNSFVRKQYKSGIEHAKKQRKEGKKQVQQNLQPEAEDKVPAEHGHKEANPSVLYEFGSVISYLQKIYDKANSAAENSEEKEEALARVKELELENERLEKELNSLEQDYQALMEILDRARKMAVEKDEGSQGQHKAKFQVDKFGNLERIE